MKRMGKNESITIIHFFIYALAFLLLWEWLRPLPVITDIGMLNVLVFYALFSAVVTFLPIPIFISIPLILIGNIYGLHHIFGDGRLTIEGIKESVSLFAGELTYNFSLILSWDIALLTNYFRTFLLFLLLTLICYLLYFWIFQTKRIFLFVIATIVYIGILDTFTVVDGSMAIIRIVVMSFFMMTLLHMLTIEEKDRGINSEKNRWSFSSTWLYTLTLMILIAVAAAYVAPKHDPQWADPMPSLRLHIGDGSRDATVKKVGYGRDDTALGGGFENDDGTVFFAQIDQPFYWRGESKHEYTGRGWTSDPHEYDSYSVYEDEIDYYMYRDSVEVEELEVTISMEEGRFDHFFYPGQPTSLIEDSLSYLLGDRMHINQDKISFLTDVAGGKISAYHEEEELSLLEYSLEFQSPQFSIQALEDDSQEDPESIKELYLQLPDTLPERVYDLAEEIVADYETRYEQVEAIESYFSSNNFRYETKDVPIPEGDQDYVDQFLFETKYGYCDNYSTAMAVLLRAVDIPSRWVKGFTAGEATEDDDGNKVFEVKNNNAHSWVEVYFPQAGWVPFEPTKGFDNNVEFVEEEEELDEVIEDGDDLREDPPEVAPPLLDDRMHLPKTEWDNQAAGDGSLRDKFQMPELSELLTLKNMMILIFTMLLVIVLYRKKEYLLNYYFIILYRIIGRDDRFLSAYKRLLWLLKNQGFPRKDHETLREYAERIDLTLGLDALKELTQAYEKVYYGGQTVEGEWKELQEDWENVIKSLTPLTKRW